jgi:TM2 domain-containing membrane protein YozV
MENLEASSVALAEASNKKLAAGLLGIFFGALGVHKFVLGYSTPGVIMLVVTLAGGVVTCGVSSFVMGVIGLIEGIIYLTKTPQEFKSMYLDAPKEWF